MVSECHGAARFCKTAPRCSLTVTKIHIASSPGIYLSGLPGKAAPPGMGRMQIGNVPMFPMPTGPLQSMSPAAVVFSPAAATPAPAPPSSRETTLTERVASRLPSAQWRGRDSPGSSSMVTSLPYCLTTSTQSHRFITVYLRAYNGDERMKEGKGTSCGKQQYGMRTRFKTHTQDLPLLMYLFLLFSSPLFLSTSHYLISSLPPVPSHRDAKVTTLTFTITRPSSHLDAMVMTLVRFQGAGATRTSYDNS